MSGRGGDVTEFPEGFVRECCARAEMRRRVAEERAHNALAALGRIQRSRNAGSARELANQAIFDDACLWRLDEALKDEAKPGQKG
jgi:hypothetical protein